MVTIVNPHIKRDNSYYIRKEATSLGLYIKNKHCNKDFDGWCWPGSSWYLDFTTKKVQSWWADQFHYNKYKGSTPELFAWNNMNKPSVFNGPEVSMQKDCLNLNKCEHHEWHNLYGMLFHCSMSKGLIKRTDGGKAYVSVLSSLAKSRRGDTGTRAEALVRRIEKLALAGNADLLPDTTVYNVLINCHKNLALQAKKVLYKMGKCSVEHDVITYSSVIKVYSTMGKV